MGGLYQHDYLYYIRYDGHVADCKQHNTSTRNPCGNLCQTVDNNLLPSNLCLKRLYFIPKYSNSQHIPELMIPLMIASTFCRKLFCPILSNSLQPVNKKYCCYVLLLSPQPLQNCLTQLYIVLFVFFYIYFLNVLKCFFTPTA